MAMRPLDRLPSIRAKLGSVIVFAVAVTILILYIAMGFSLRRSESCPEKTRTTIGARSKRAKRHHGKYVGAVSG